MEQFILGLLIGAALMAVGVVMGHATKETRRNMVKVPPGPRPPYPGYRPTMAPVNPRPPQGGSNVIPPANHPRPLKPGQKPDDLVKKASEELPPSY